jgi:hypothetical protein
MRPTLFVSMFVVAAMSCVPGNNPFRITGVSKLDPMCMAPMTMGAAPANGTLDASGSVTYILQFNVESDIVMPTITDTNGMELDTMSQNDFVVEAVASTYKLTDNATNAATTIKADSRPVYGLIPTQTAGSVVVNIIGEQAIKPIVTAVNDPTQIATLIVSAKLTGHLQSGQTMSTDAISFPLTVTRSFVNGMSVDCPTQLSNGANATSPTGPCGSGGGQDGAAITCL